jgi:hypothetical protein
VSRCAVTDALEEANRLRLDAFEHDDPILHVAADLRIERLASIAETEALLERSRARLRARRTDFAAK